MQRTLESNFKVWNDTYQWPQDGDEWDGQARACRQPYEAWKQAIVNSLILPYLYPAATIVEIGAGHGRWSEEIMHDCHTLILVDFSPNCIAYCQQRFAAQPHLRYLLNDGQSLPGIADASVDFVWSFDCFVHLEADILSAYLSEIKRVLKPGGRAVIHHAGRRHWFRHLSFLASTGRLGQRCYNWLSLGCWQRDDGARSQLSRQLVCKLVKQAGLTLETQKQYWGQANEFGVARYNDWITILQKPAYPANQE
ncbi:hypothetical protein BH10CHL1_BH10CHL1_41560 [soil metagenome]